MNTTAPSGEETTLSMASGTYYYWYTDPPLTAGTISEGTWTLRVYVSWAGTGVNKGTYEVNLVSSDGSTIRATLVYPTSGPTAKQGSFWYQISMDAASATVTENDRIRLSLKFSKPTTLFYDGNAENEATEQSRLEFTGSAPPPISESLFGTLAFALIAFTVYILCRKRTLIKFKQQCFSISSFVSS